MSAEAALGLFEGYGIEIEYMIVDANTLDVRPVADELLRSVSGSYEAEVDRGDLAWSNELALHVVELKTNGPAATIVNLGESFQAHVGEINERLAQLDACLLPTGMHPWMDPDREFRLWPHEYNTVYATFDRIFECAGHGWANVQSTHVNLPFADDAEFGRLHAATRLVLPIIPGLAASTPAADGALTGLFDTRLKHYAGNAARVSSITGAVIPEPIFTIGDYERLLRGIYADLAPFDPEGVLRHEWVNARGAIPRFDRMALEIRIIDTQECPDADIAVAAAIIAAVRWQVEEAWCGARQQRAWDHRELAVILAETTSRGDGAVIHNRRFLDCFGYPERGRARCNELWQHISEVTATAVELSPGSRAALANTLQHGCLARRITAACQHSSLQEVYFRLAACLATGQPLVPGA